MSTDTSLLLLSVLFGLSFGILVLFSYDFLAIGIVLAIIAAGVFAASREDLKELGRRKSLIALMVLIAVFVVSFSVSISSEIGGLIFDILTGLAFAILIAYIVVSRLSRSQVEET